ncbi:hypothetical protein [Aurantiacibacter poecillastricola]|uniref:hypothetical protein n=1 Tax=Aurantiacibacter poecillastricola TaxID=3064385 RepID=UPI00273EC135|nr:hypothetical protein [Aurantiacibacter sp. 219JJ12-13]MDP5261158.1 hypothetical protein [Aurantiacibacter sp. 219JJ12-13]
MDRETEQARELHRTLEFIGLRAQATAVGLLQLCAELVKAGVLDTEAVERIKQSIFREIAANQPRGYNRAEFERTLRQRLDAVFPCGDTVARQGVGNVQDMEASLDPSAHPERD